MDNFRENEIDDILEQVRAIRENREAGKTGETDNRERKWSMDDIDRLIAETSGEVYIPKHEPQTPTESFNDILSREYSPQEILSRRRPRTEMQDISSNSSDAEVDGQQTFDIGRDNFDPDTFELETVIIPEDDDGPIETNIFEEDDDFIKETAETVRKIFSETENKIAEEQKNTAAAAFEKETEAADTAVPARETEAGNIIPETESAKNTAAPAENGANIDMDGDIKSVENIDISDGESGDGVNGEDEAKPDSGHIDENEYRKRFFQKMMLDEFEEIDDEDDGIIEKASLLIRKNGDSEVDAGLEAMPVLVDAVRIFDEEKTRIIADKKAAQKEEADRDNDVDGQMTLTGFAEDEAETAPEAEDEVDIEENLSERRRKKAEDFRLTDDFEINSGLEGDYNAPADEIAREEKAKRKAERRREINRKNEERTVGEEYTDPIERAGLHARLTRKAEKSVKDFAVTAVIEALLILVTVIPSLAEKLSIETAVFAKGSTAVYVISALLLVFAAVFNSDKIIRGVSNASGGKITVDFAIFLSLSAALFQNIVLLVCAKEEDYPFFTAAAVFGLLLSKFADMLDAKRILGNFEVCAFKYEHNMYAVHRLENEAEIFELGRGLMMGNADMIYSSKLAFPSGFMRNSVLESGERKLPKPLLIISVISSVAAAVLAAVFTKDAITTICAFAGVFCLCVPTVSLFLPSFILSYNDRTLNKAGTMIVSLDEAEKVSGANAVVIDSADIFSSRDCTMHGMKDFESIRMDDVLLYAAALVIKSGGPLRDCFEKVIDGRQDILPPVKELNYEDKLGISARIHNQKVLLGNRNMLIHHNIEVPENEFEEKFMHSGRKIIYLAVAEKLAAMFVVSYAVDKRLENYIGVLEENGIQLLIRTNDVNITEELISEKFALPQENFKVLSAVAGKLFKRRKDAVCDKLPAGIIHDGTGVSMLRAVAVSCKMMSKVRLGNTLQTVFSVLAFVLAATVIFTGNAGLLTGVTALFYVIAGTLISTALTFLGRTK